MSRCGSLCVNFVLEVSLIPRPGYLFSSLGWWSFQPLFYLISVPPFSLLLSRIPIRQMWQRMGCVGASAWCGLAFSWGTPRATASSELEVWCWSQKLVWAGGLAGVVLAGQKECLVVFNQLPLHWDSEGVSLWMHTLRVEYSTVLWLAQCKPYWFKIH